MESQTLTLSRRLRWYAKRFSVMGPAEVAHRVREQFVLQRLALEHGLGWVPRVPRGIAFLESREPQLPVLPFDAAGLAAISERVIGGHWQALGFDWRWEDREDIWQVSPDTGHRWPTSFFGRIDHRTGNAHGDVRVAWEPARLQQLVTLALLAKGNDRKAMDMLEQQLLSFVRCNRPWAGVHFLSAMECALRLIAVCHAYDLSRDQLIRPEVVSRAVSELVASHACLIDHRLSLYSSSGNHTIAEAAGLVYAGSLFAEFDAAHGWRTRGLELLVTELQRQVLDDGGGLEQSFWYLLFIADLGGLVQALLEHRGCPVPAQLTERVGLARLFIAEFASTPLDLPDFGDRDDGHALSPLLRLSFPEASVRSSSRSFHVSGYSSIRTQAALEDWRLVFDHGRFGMSPSFGHAHADALSITLQSGVVNLLIDPGTGSYTGRPEWRRYFRSTAAHNTITVDGRDQATQETPFQWSAPPTARLVRSDTKDCISRLLAVHDGYTGSGVLHWRGLVLHPAQGLLVWDVLDGAPGHLLTWHWHSSSCIESSGNRWRLGAGWSVSLPAELEVRVHKGESAPMLGWRSPVYGRIEPAWTLSASVRPEEPREFVTVFSAPGADIEFPGLDSHLDQLRAWRNAA